jgi:tryptophan--tRNA ligase
MKKRMISGIKPTGELTLGNYIGAIKQFIQYQEEYELFVFLADLHALTLPIDANELRKNSEDILAIYLACGLDPNKVVIFKQSDIHEHAELGYIMACNSYMGELQRMTQYKDKTQKMKNDSIPTGIFIYPTLMAADILLYQADFVPVGIDQKQHVELTRDLVIRFNHHYQKDVFALPAPVLPKQGAKITSLSNPLKKMSKSESDKGTIYLLEDVQIARKKIMSAVTDSENEIRYDMENKPGISNLLTILSVLTHQSIDDLQQKYQNVGYGQFKKDVADVVCHELETLQQKVQEIKNGHILESILKQGASKASSIASQTLQQVYEVIGIK